MTQQTNPAPQGDNNSQPTRRSFLLDKLPGLAALGGIGALGVFLYREEGKKRDPMREALLALPRTEFYVEREGPLGTKFDADRYVVPTAFFTLHEQGKLNDTDAIAELFNVDINPGDATQYLGAYEAGNQFCPITSQNIDYKMEMLSKAIAAATRKREFAPGQAIPARGQKR